MASNLKVGLKGIIVGIVLAIIFAVLIIVANVVLSLLFNKYTDVKFGFEIIILLATLLMALAAAVAGWLAAKSASSTDGADRLMAPLWAGLITGIAAWVLFIVIHLSQLLIHIVFHAPMVYGGNYIINTNIPVVALGSCCRGPVVLIFCIAAAVLAAALVTRKK